MRGFSGRDPISDCNRRFRKWSSGAPSTDAGGAYPVTSLNHIYLAAGPNTVNLTTNWTGTFSMAGGPPIVIPGGAIPRVSTPFVLDVYEARGVLVTG